MTSQTTQANALTRLYGHYRTEREERESNKVDLERERREDKAKFIGH